MTIAIAAALGMMAVVGLFYVYVLSNGPAAKVDGAAIVAAAHNYTANLRARAQPIPHTIPLEQLVKLRYLKPEQVAAFHGLQATLSLTADSRNPRTVLMQVHMLDGADIVLLNDGSVQEAPR